MWKQISKWFIKFAWPEIKKMIVKLLPIVMKWFASFIEEALNKKATKKAEEANEKSQAAAEKAKVSTSDVEAAGYRAEAETWRKVAQDYERELTEIKQLLDESQQKVQPILEVEISHMDPEKLFTRTKDGELMLNSSQLPALPPAK